MKRRDFIRRSAAATAGLATMRRARAVAAPSFDFVIRGGTILDGTGGPPFVADLGIQGDAIAALGSIAADQARRVLDASGLHVCPGFIDIHTHSDRDILTYPTDDSRVRQGVTTEVTGNCGSSAAPAVKGEWTDVASYCERVDREKVSVNQALLLGQGTLRANRIGLADRPLAADELRSVLRDVEEGMDQGAFGLSTGLEYTPGRYTPADEIVQMARVVARYGGLYASHIRNEDASLLESVNEAIDVGRRSGARVEVSHLKAAGKPFWGKQRAALDLIESARHAGIDVLADAYPYSAYSTGLTILLDSKTLEGGTAAMLARLREDSDRARIRKELHERVSRAPGDYDLIVISQVRTPANRPLVGKNMVQIAEQWRVKPADAILRLIQEEEGSVSFVGHGISPANVEMVLSHPLVMIGSDGSSMAPVGRAAETRPHPRSYGSHARVLAYYARERRLFDLPTAVRKMTGMPADQAGLHDRGRIARGRKADLVVFNAATIRDEATFDNPHRYASGIDWVLVNGVVVVEKGMHSGARPGKMLRRA